MVVDSLVAEMLLFLSNPAEDAAMLKAINRSNYSDLDALHDDVCLGKVLLGEHVLSCRVVEAECRDVAISASMQMTEASSSRVAD